MVVVGILVKVGFGVQYLRWDFEYSPDVGLL